MEETTKDKNKEHDELVALYEKLLMMVNSIDKQLDECKMNIDEEKKQHSFVKLSFERLSSAAESWNTGQGSSRPSPGSVGTPLHGSAGG